MQSMVWCNQLVVALARLLQDMVQPSALPASLHDRNDKSFQQHIIHRMQAMTQPRLVPLLQWDLSPSQRAVSRETGQSDAVRGKACQPRQMSYDSMASEGHVLNIIQVSRSSGCLQG